jgi:hypothetical protein
MKAMMKVGPGEKKPTYGQQKVTSRVIKRNKKGGLTEEGSETTSTEMYADDRKRKAGTGSGTFDGSAAPRTGGVAIAKTTPVVGGTKKQVRFAKTNVRRNSASPQAKRSAMKLYK